MRADGQTRVSSATARKDEPHISRREEGASAELDKHGLWPTRMYLDFLKTLTCALSAKKQSGHPSVFVWSSVSYRSLGSRQSHSLRQTGHVSRIPV